MSGNFSSKNPPWKERSMFCTRLKWKQRSWKAVLRQYPRPSSLEVSFLSLRLQLHINFRYVVSRSLLTAENKGKTALTFGTLFLSLVFPCLAYLNLLNFLKGSSLNLKGKLVLFLSSVFMLLARVVTIGSTLTLPVILKADFLQPILSTDFSQLLIFHNIRYLFNTTFLAMQYKGGPKKPKSEILRVPFGFPFHWSWVAQNSFRNRCSMSGRSGTGILLYCRGYSRENSQK